MIRCPLCGNRFSTWETTDRVCECDQNKVREYLVEELEDARAEIQRLNERIDTIEFERGQERDFDDF